MRHILIVTAVSTVLMAVATTLNNVSIVNADTVSDNNVESTNVQAQTDNNIKTGTWGTATWSWNQNTSEITVSGGQAGEASDAPWNRNRPNFGLKKIDFTGKLTLPANCDDLFSALTGLTDLSGMSNLDTSNVTDMRMMFYNMPSITKLDVSHFDTSKVTNMMAMFSGDRSLGKLDVSHFDTSKVTKMNDMFSENFVLRNLDVSHFNTSNVNDMSTMFYAMFRLKNLDVSHFDTSNVTNMSNMFGRLNDLNELDVSHFNTSKVTDMSYMFMWTFNLTNLNLSNFDMSKVTDVQGMFEDDSRLNTLALGLKNRFASNAELPAVKETNDYLGKWKNSKDANGNNINNGNIYTSDDLLTNYTSDRAGTYVWAKKNNNVSDIKDLYNNAKLAISYSAGMFNSEPGNSLKYKDEFNGRSIYGALDYAYNSNNYNELIKVMHDSLTKVHESIGSLQVNDAKAQELGLNTDQLKEDLVKDSVPYDYSQDNDVDGINKQLESFASVRAKYNKLVKQGVFDKSDYWTINK